MEAETITQLIAVVVLLGGALIAAGVTLASQLITKKYENEKLKKQLLFKILEDELKEKKQTIKPFIQFINSLNLPENFNFYDDGNLSIKLCFINRILIKSKASDFLLVIHYTLHHKFTMRFGRLLML
ncbi:hypothetical protein ACLBOM_02830 [Escherichia coli]